MSKKTIKAGPSAFGKFLTKHADEVQTTAGVLKTLVRLIPLDPKTKLVLNASIGGLDEAAERIRAKAPTEPGSAIGADDVREAIAPVLPDLVREQVRELFEEFAASEAMAKAIAGQIEAAKKEA